jgi:hypothetical protein
MFLKYIRFMDKHAGKFFVVILTSFATLLLATVWGTILFGSGGAVPQWFALLFGAMATIFIVGLILIAPLLVWEDVE